MSSRKVIKVKKEFLPESMSKPWVSHDDAGLLDGIKKGRSIEQIAGAAGHSIEFIRSRLKKIAADYYINKQMPFDQIELITGIKKEEIIIRASSPTGGSKESISSVESVDTQEAFTIDVTPKEVTEIINEPVEKPNPCTDLTIRLIDLTIYLAFTLRRNILKKAQGTIIDEYAV